MKLHHIAIACEDIDAQREKVKRVHRVTKESEIVYDENQKAKVCYLEIEQGIYLELVSGEAVSQILAKGISYYHVCYEVDDMEKTIKEFEEKQKKLESISKEIHDQVFPPQQPKKDTTEQPKPKQVEVIKK